MSISVKFLRRGRVLFLLANPRCGTGGQRGGLYLTLNETDRAISSKSFRTAPFAQRITKLRQERSYKALTLSLTSEALAVSWEAPLPHYSLPPRGYSL